MKILGNIAQSAGLLLLWFALVCLVDPLFTHLAGGRNHPWVNISIFSVSALIAACILGCSVKKQRWLLGILMRISATEIGVASLGAVAVVVLGIAMALPFSYVVPCTACASGSTYLSMFSSSFFVGGSEEVWCASIFLGTSLLLLGGRGWPAAVLSAVIFAQMHAHSARPDLLHWLRFFVAGTIMARMTIRFRSIWPAVAFHAVMDGLIAAFLLGSAGSNPILATTSDTLTSLEIVPLTLALLFLAYLDRDARDRPQPHDSRWQHVNAAG